MISIFLRSILFNILFYINLVGLMLLGLPCLLMNRHAAIGMARQWGKNSVWLLKHVCHLRVEFAGLENIPEGAAIMCAKHQSILETFALIIPIDDFTYIVKRELTFIPLFGWYLWGTEQLAINRKKGSSALNQVATLAREILPQGRKLFIFPEGTRRPAGAPPDYKFGATYLYAETGVPCLPVALDAGLFWPRRSFLRRPGVLTIEFLPIIEPGLSRQEFAALLQERIETATNRLMAAAIARDPSLADNMMASPQKEQKRTY